MSDRITLNGMEWETDNPPTIEKFISHNKKARVSEKVLATHMADMGWIKLAGPPKCSFCEDYDITIQYRMKDRGLHVKEKPVECPICHGTGLEPEAKT